MEQYILAHDIGTSSDKAVLVRFDGSIRAVCTAPYPTHYPQPAWVEQDPADYWKAVAETCRRVVAENNIDPAAVKGMVFSTQAQGVIPVDEKGEALYPNITWVDGGAEKQARSIMARLGGKKIFTMAAGTPIMGKDCIAKIIWLKEERPELYRRTKYFLDVNGYLRFRCTGRMAAELSGASSYGLDLKKKTWLGVLPLTGIDMAKLPPLICSTDLAGGLTTRAAADTGLPAGTPVFGGCDDVQAAAVGAGQQGDGDIHVCLGTSAWVAAVSKTADKFKHGAAAIQSADPASNLIAGITESAGSNIEWIRDQFFKSEKEQYGEGIFVYMDEIISRVPPGSDSLICTPWMLGERCPVSSTTTRGTLFNLNLLHTREHLMRAVYEGIAYNIRWILENFSADYGFCTQRFRILGGGALDTGWMQILSDVTGSEISVVRNPRSAGAVGAAAIALIGLGVLPDFAATKDFARVELVYRPNGNNRAVYDGLYQQYRQIYRALAGVYQDANGAPVHGRSYVMTQSELEQRLTALGGRLAEAVPAWQGTLTAALRNETGSCVLAEFEAGTEEMRGSDRNEEAFAAVFAQKREVWAALLVETPYTLQIANTLTALPAELDDMAQIVGLTARVSPSLAAPALKKALHRRGACLVRGRGMLVTGRSAQEAVTAAVLLEKACRTHVLAQKIGGAKRVPLLSALLMHIIYQKKYSAIDLTEQSRRGEVYDGSRTATGNCKLRRTSHPGGTGPGYLGKHRSAAG